MPRAPHGYGSVTRIVRCECGRDVRGKAARCDRCGAALAGRPVWYLARIRRPGGLRETHVEPTSQLAERWLAEKRKQRVDDESGATQAGRGWEDRTVTYADLREDLEEWFDACNDISDTTRRGYRSELNSLLDHWGKRRVAETREHDVTAYVAACRRQDLSRQTIANRLCRLRQLMDQAVRSELLRRRPCEVQSPRRRRGEGVRDVAPEGLVAALVKAAARPPLSDDPRVLAAVLLAADAGLRRGELVLPRGEHVTLKADDRALGWIRVPVLGPRLGPKTMQSRDVPILTPRLLEALRALRPRKRVPLLEPITSPEGVDYLLRPLWTAVGCGGVLHRLRHRFSTWAQTDLAVPLPIVSQWLGHARVTTTAIYTHGRVEPPAGAATRAAAWGVPAETVGKSCAQGVPSRAAGPGESRRSHLAQVVDP